MYKYLLSAAVSAAAVIASPAAAQTFNGPYVGATVGINAGTVETQDYWCDAACDAPTLKGIDAAIGVTAGFNHQVDNFVVGLEGDLGTGFSDSEETTYGYTGYSEVYDWSAKLKWLSTVRARAGLAMDRTMVFGTAGLAIAKGRFSQRTTNSSYDDWGASTKETLTGYVLGGGIERQVNSRLSVKAEFLHYDLGKSDRACYADLEGTDAGECWDDGDAGIDDYVVWNPTVNQVRLGVNVRF